MARRSVAWQITRPPIAPSVTRVRRAARNPGRALTQQVVWTVASPAMPKDRRSRRAARLAARAVRRSR